ncbi:MAG TPA: hypothetical protein VGM99_06960 [Candidatus Cybelea sp.]
MEKHTLRLTPRGAATVANRYNLRKDKAQYALNAARIYVLISGISGH